MSRTVFRGSSEEVQFLEKRNKGMSHIIEVVRVRVSYGTIIKWLLITWAYFSATYLLLVLFLKLPLIVFFAVTIAVLSITMFLFDKYIDEMFAKIERDIEELMRHSSDNLER